MGEASGSIGGSTRRTTPLVVAALVVGTPAFAARAEGLGDFKSVRRG
jgi:hypothetical protein